LSVEPPTSSARPGAQLEPLSVKLLKAAGVLSLLLVLVVVNSLLNTSGGESPFNPNPVAAAAQRTEEVPGMRMNLTATVTSEGTPPSTVTGHGAFNGEDNLGEFTYNAAVNGQQMSFDAVMSEDAWYFRYPQYAGRMPEGKEWIKLEGYPGQKDISSPGTGNPSESLGMLRATGSVDRLGQVKIGKVETTHYRVTLSPEGILQALHAEGKDELAEAIEGQQVQFVGPIHAEVFITPGGLLRRMRTVTTVLAEGKTVSTDMRADLFDYGIHPEIQVPDDSQVLEFGPELKEQMEALGQPS
jgi:hypothetical protein